jgi:hypothetical protein
VHAPGCRGRVGVRPVQGEECPLSPAECASLSRTNLGARALTSVVKSWLSFPSVGGLANDKEGKKQFLVSEELSFVSDSVSFEIMLHHRDYVASPLLL